MKDIEIGPIRPPSESNSLLIRVTRGCHWNKSYFCGLYKSMRFSMRPIDETIEDIRRQAQLNRGKKITSCFLQDGDALVLKTDYAQPFICGFDSMAAEHPGRPDSCFPTGTLHPE